MAHEVGTAVAMSERLGQKPEQLSSHLQGFLNRMFRLEISNLEGEIITDLAPATVTLFKVIEKLITAAQFTLIEKITASSNVDAFTKGAGESGIAENIPPEMIPLVIAALARIAAISQNAHVEYDNMKSQLPTLLMQLKDDLARQAALIQDAAIKALEKRKAILENSQPNVAQATADLAHDSSQQLKVKKQTSWFKTTIANIKEEIKEKKRTLQDFASKHNFLEAGADQLLAPLAM